MQKFEISRARPDELNNVEAFYRERDYRGGVSEQDTILVAKRHEELIGVVRLCPENGFMVLRGMRVAEQYQRRGVGSALLLKCAPHLDQGIAFCLPYTHLIAFYQIIGFEQSNEAELPTFLADRLREYNRDGKGVLAMRRVPASLASR